MSFNEGAVRPKYRIPRVRLGGVKRSRLFDLLDRASTAPVTVISAAAGSGKTFLVAGWSLAKTDRCTAWLRLAAEDRDPARLLRNLFHATRGALAGDGIVFDTAALLAGPDTPPVEALVDSFSNDLHRLQRPLVLVLDDYHEVDTPAVATMLAALVEGLPATAGIVVMTRHAPGLPIPAWQARAQVTLIGQAELAFSSGEAADFLRSTMELPLRDESAAVLHARTEGWIAGLQLAALSLQARPADTDVDAAASALTARHHVIRDYLAGDIVGRVDARMAAFLEQTSVLDSLCASLCDELTGGDDAAERLRELEQRNLFIVPLDGERDWYRYHDLFREHLQDRLTPALRAPLHRRASEWFAARRHHEDAFRHVAATGRHDDLVDFIRRHGEAIMGSGAAGDLLGWINTLPADEALRHPDITGLRAWLLYLRGTEREAEPFARAALAHRDEPIMQTGLMLAFRTYSALRWDGPGDVIELAATAVQRLAPDSHKLRSLMASYRGQALAQAGEADAAIDSYLLALRADASLGKLDGIPGTLVHLVDLLLERGRSAEARSIASVQVHAASRSAGLSTAAGPPYLALATVMLSANELDAAEAMAESGLKRVDKAGLVYYRLLARTLLARVLHAKGQRAMAWSLLDEARRTSQQSGGLSRRSLVETAIAHLRLQEGNEALALPALALVERSPAENPAGVEPMLHARLLLAQRRPREVAALLLPILERADSGGFVRSAIEARLLLARAHEASGQRADALALLREALVRGEDGHYLRLFVDLAPGLGPVLTAAAAVAPGFTARVVAALKAEPAPHHEQAAGLTAKDREVLTLISHGLQNKEIADALHVTVGTAKQYVNRLYSKLGTRNRVEAISEGRRQQLIN